MSQVGTLVSVAPIPIGIGGGWNVEYQYALDAGGTQLAQVVVGSAAIPLWANPGATITVVPNPPGTTNPVTLACPWLVKADALGAVPGVN